MIPAFQLRESLVLEGRDYYPVVMEAIRASVSRVWGTMFIVDLARGKDSRLLVRDMLKLLARKSEAGVDVRILLGTSTIREISVGNKTSLFFLKDAGVKVKEFAGKFTSSTHSKYCLFDDDAFVLGSHNWSENAFLRNHESSIFVESKDLNRRLAQDFIRDWENSSAAEGGTARAG